jgi:hypothetical protein
MRPFILLLLPALAFSAILPDTIGPWKKGEPSTAFAKKPDNHQTDKVWREYGLQDAETAGYSDGSTSYVISAYRFGDATGAMAAFDDALPSDARPASLMGMAAEDASEELVAAGNYLFIFNGYKIKPEELSHIVATVPNYSHSPLPTLPKYMPEGARANSQRYITGPDSLARFAPSVPPSTAAFHFSAEAELAAYGPTGKETTLMIFSYPTMEMARDRYPHFQQIPGAMAKRTGPLVALTLNAPSADEAERLLSKVKYQTTVTVPEHPPSPKDNPGNLFWNIFILCLVLAGFCIASGVVVGGLRVILRRVSPDADDDGMISLHLSGRP